MTLRFRTIFAFSVVIVVLVIGLFFVTQSYVDEGYLAVEKQSAETNMERALQAVNRELTILERTALDYARWDETYHFVGEQNQDYLESSLGANVFANLNLDNVVIYDSAGRVIYEVTYHAQTGSLV